VAQWETREKKRRDHLHTETIWLLIRKKRPAVIVSNDAANRHLNRVQVVPLTSKAGRVYPSEAQVVFKGKPGKALADQLTTVIKRRLLNRAGKLSDAEMGRVERAVRVQLDLV